MLFCTYRLNLSLGMSKSEDLREKKPSECSLLFSTLILTYIYVLIQGDNHDERDGREERPRRRSTLLVPGLGRRARERAEPKEKEVEKGSRDRLAERDPKSWVVT